MNCQARPEFDSTIFLVMSLSFFRSHGSQNTWVATLSILTVQLTQFRRIVRKSLNDKDAPRNSCYKQNSFDKNPVTQKQLTSPPICYYVFHVKLCEKNSKNKKLSHFIMEQIKDLSQSLSYSLSICSTFKILREFFHSLILH